jgi:uncharacterized protein
MLETSEPGNTGLLHHVEIYCADLKAKTDFWGWFLGLLGYHLYQDWPGGRSYRLGPAYIVFVQTEQRFSGFEYNRCHPGLNHLAFHAASRQQVDDVTDLLKKRGAHILYENRHPYAGGQECYAVYFEDPDRMKVELDAPDDSAVSPPARMPEESGTMDERMVKVQAALEHELACSAHNLAHVWRVFHLCLKLAEGEKDVDITVLKLASLLHDIARIREDSDDTGMTDHAQLGADMAEPILRDAGYPEQTIHHVCSCIATHRFRGAAIPASIEAQLLFDADKIDSLGAVGIARAYMLAARYGEAIYSDEDPADYVARNHVGGEPAGRIKTLSDHTPNLEFEIAFKRIPARLFTAQARAIAINRLAVMEAYFDQLRLELDGRA